MQGMRKYWVHLLSVLLLLIVTSCSGYRSAREARLAEQQGDWDQAVLQYVELVQDHPKNVSYRPATRQDQGLSDALRAG